MKRFDKLYLQYARSTMMPYTKDNLERESLLPQPLCVGRQRSRKMPRSQSLPRSLLHHHDRKLHQPPPSNQLLLVRKLHPLAKQLHPLAKPVLHLDNKHHLLDNHHHQKFRRHLPTPIPTSCHSIDHSIYPAPSPSCDRATCSGRASTPSFNSLWSEGLFLCPDPT